MVSMAFRARSASAAAAAQFARNAVAQFAQSLCSELASTSTRSAYAARDDSEAASGFTDVRCLDGGIQP